MEDQINARAAAIVARLAGARKSQDVSVNRLHKLTGLSRRAISLIEQGERRPTIHSVLAITDALNLKLSTVLLEVEREESNQEE